VGLYRGFRRVSPCINDLIGVDLMERGCPFRFYPSLAILSCVAMALCIRLSAGQPSGLVDIGGRKLFIACTGEGYGPTVIWKQGQVKDLPVGHGFSEVSNGSSESAAMIVLEPARATHMGVTLVWTTR
jgi:hypothetical protein